jgi:hypothetical protein
MPDKARDLHEIISASVRDMLDAYRLQAQAGHVKDQALEEIIYRAAHPIVTGLPAHSAEDRGAVLPSVVRIMLAAFLEDVFTKEDREC